MNILYIFLTCFIVVLLIAFVTGRYSSKKVRTPKLDRMLFRRYRRRE